MGGPLYPSPPFIFVGQTFDLDRGSPAPPPSCVSPGSFYAGVNPSPPRPSPTSGNASGDDADVDASEDKENNRPLPDGGNTTRLREEAGGLLATSKFFGGGGGDRGGGGKGPLGQQSGLRGRFRPPLAAARHSSAAAPAASCLGKGRGGGGGEKIGRDDDNNGNPDSWGAEFAYPRLHVSRETPGNNAGCGSEGNTGVSVGGSRLKRRRTLGVRSLLPNGMKRGLEGTAGIGGAWLGRRSKSLGGLNRRKGTAAVNLTVDKWNDALPVFLSVSPPRPRQLSWLFSIRDPPSPLSKIPVKPRTIGLARTFWLG